MKAMGLGRGSLEIHNARLSKHNARYVDFLYQRLGRQGSLKRDCQRMVNQNRNVFAACMVACGEADAMVTGLTRSFGVAYEDISHAIDPRAKQRVFGLPLMVVRGRALFIADTSVHELPNAEQLTDIAQQSAAHARAHAAAPPPAPHP